MKISRPTHAKVPRRTRERPREGLRTSHLKRTSCAKVQVTRAKCQEIQRHSRSLLELETCHLTLRALSAQPHLRLHRPAGRLALSRVSAQWRFVMRYRSATVADSHGLPLNLERNKRTTNPRRLREPTGSAQPFCLRVSCQAPRSLQRWYTPPALKMKCIWHPNPSSKICA